MTPGREIVGGQRNAVNQDLPCCGREQTQQQVGNGGFAGSAAPDQRSHRALRNAEGNAPEHGFLTVLVGKADIAEFNQSI